MADSVDVAGDLKPVGVVKRAAADTEVVWKTLEGQSYFDRAVTAEVQVETSSMLAAMVVYLGLSDNKGHLRLQEHGLHQKRRAGQPLAKATVADIAASWLPKDSVAERPA